MDDLSAREKEHETGHKEARSRESQLQEKIKDLERELKCLYPFTRLHNALDGTNDENNQLRDKVANPKCQNCLMKPNTTIEMQDLQENNNTLQKFITNKEELISDRDSKISMLEKQLDDKEELIKARDEEISMLKKQLYGYINARDEQIRKDQEQLRALVNMINDTKNQIMMDDDTDDDMLEV
ncbi:hypothetical protein OPT61_g8647 [Boeremia exigua]|uniref:Uncharacterized protein n=1 Tax=Boeremia exigua TaxID=749465 RepID=A0ACC2HXU0_9PLEO|nr:hypothetical protein OPT61_g8647 [Boeremia exigua]